MKKRVLFYTHYIGMALIVVFIGLIGAFFVRRFFERQTQLKVMAAFESQLASNQLADHSYTGAGTSDFSLVNGETMAILRLDRLGIKVGVAEGLDKQTLRISAGHFPGSGTPGEGNFAIAGHSSMLYTCLFNNLSDAVIGDTITVTAQNGRTNYIVTEIMTVDPEDVYVVDNTNESIITIVSCEKFANFNGGNKRLIIRGIEA